MHYLFFCRSPNYVVKMLNMHLLQKDFKFAVIWAYFRPFEELPVVQISGIYFFPKQRKKTVPFVRNIRCVKIEVQKLQYTPSPTDMRRICPSRNCPPVRQLALRFLVIGDSHKKGDSPFFWWLVIHLVIHLFCFSISITNCESPEKKVGSLLTLIISNRQSPKKFCSFFTFNSHLSIANFFI